MASIDLKDAYYVIQIAESDRKFLMFFFDNALYEFICLPFGLNGSIYFHKNNEAGDETS